MNLNKLNKDQLINKIKDQENKSSGNHIIKDIHNLYNILKGLFLKLTLLTLIIKYFKKYKFIRKILFFFNSIILSLFGISVLDIYDSNLVLNLIEWIRSTHLYKILIEILENKVEKIETKLEKIETKVEKIESSTNIMRTNNQISTGIEKSNESNQNNNRWFNKEEIINKYTIFITLFLLTGLSWFFWEDLNFFLSSRKPDLGGNTPNLNENISDLLDCNEEYQKYFKEKSTNEELYDLEIIRNQTNGKTIDYSDVENYKWDETSDGATTPKADFHKLPSNEKLMIPISKDN